MFDVRCSMFSNTLLITQRLHGFQPAGAPRGQHAAENADDKRAATNQRDVAGDNYRRQFAKAVNGSREQFKTGPMIHEVQKSVPVSQRQNAQTVTREHAEHADDGALTEKDPGDLEIRRAERLEHSDFARFLDDERDLRAEDAQRGDEEDEKQQVKHDVFLNDKGIENGGILFHPGVRDEFIAEHLLQLPLDRKSVVSG